MDHQKYYPQHDEVSPQIYKSGSNAIMTSQNNFTRVDGANMQLSSSYNYSPETTPPRDRTQYSNSADVTSYESGDLFQYGYSQQSNEYYGDHGGQQLNRTAYQASYFDKQPVAKQQNGEEAKSSDEKLLQMRNAAASHQTTPDYCGNQYQAQNFNDATFGYNGDHAPPYTDPSPPILVNCQGNQSPVVYFNPDYPNHLLQKAYGSSMSTFPFQPATNSAADAPGCQSKPEFQVSGSSTLYNNSYMNHGHLVGYHENQQGSYPNYDLWNHNGTHGSGMVLPMTMNPMYFSPYSSHLGEYTFSATKNYLMFVFDNKKSKFEVLSICVCVKKNNRFM